MGGLRKLNKLYICLILHRVCYHNNIFTLAVPNLIWVFMSNQYDDIEPIQNPECRKNNQSQGLLTCLGSTSILFDGVIGGPLSDDEDLLQYYTWRQELTPMPYVAMNFDPPLVEVPNITLYFYHTGGDIQGSMATNISMSFLRSLDSECNTIEVPQLSDPNIGEVVRLVMLPTNTTSVKYLRINMELLPPHDEHLQDYIFLSEIRVAERLQGSDVYIIGCITVMSYTYDCMCMWIAQLAIV